MKLYATSGKEIKENEPVRIAALWHEGCGVARTKVIFRDSLGNESACWMDREIYNAIPLMQNATIEDYKMYGRVDVACNTDIYSNL